MKTIILLTKEAAGYKVYYVGAILSAFLTTIVNLTASRVLSAAMAKV